MKKKFLNSLLVVLSFFLVITAADALTAKAPAEVPDENALLYAAVDSNFDFSKIKFTTTNGTEVAAMNNMKKIMLATGIIDGSVPELNANWFSAYCLDGSEKYPNTGYALMAPYLSTDQTRFEAALRAAFYNMTNSADHLGGRALYELIDTAKDYTGDPIIDFVIPDGQAYDYAKAMSDLVNNKEVTVTLTNVTYSNLSTNQLKTFTAEELSTALYGDGTKPFEVTITRENMLFNMYTSTKMPTTKNYNHALWIIEHSYPTFDLNTAIQLAGGDVQTLLNEVKALHPEATDDEAATLMENYVYSTVQYAIWKAVDGKDSLGTELGDSLVGSTELNKLYQYLIADRAEYATYGSQEFGASFGLNFPKGKDIIAKETKEYYKYGPFSITSGLVSYETATVTAKGNVKGAKMVDVAGNEITKVNRDQEFYVIAEKDANITTLDVEIATDDGYVFEPSSNRGRIYYSNYALGQNVLSGGIIKPVTATQSFSLEFNPKTGVEDVAILLVITLVSFAIGYFVLKFNNQPVQF